MEKKAIVSFLSTEPIDSMNMGLILNSAMASVLKSMGTAPEEKPQIAIPQKKIITG